MYEHGMEPIHVCTLLLHTHGLPLLVRLHSSLPPLPTPPPPAVTNSDDDEFANELGGESAVPEARKFLRAL